jgi:tRNA(Arg) A34 adenosine deaminase TadA
MSSFPRELHAAAIIACRHSFPDRRSARVGCVIRRRDGATVKAHNGAVSKPTKRFPELHAEVRATRKADVGAVAYVARVRRDGTYGNAKPCYSCEAIMRARGIIRAYYTLSDTEWGCVELIE